MHNLSHREAIVSLLLIAIACVASYQAWFAPALAQTERDRIAIERLLATLAKPTEPARPAALAVAPSRVVADRPLSPPVVGAPTRVPRKPVTPKRAQPALDLSCANETDPLCGALDR